MNSRNSSPDMGVFWRSFWLHFSREEQLRRFKNARRNPLKQHKITGDDWRNREKWETYREAVNEMVLRTATEYAPWHLVPSEGQTLCPRLCAENAL